jgi:purine-binding chemotaxis protein CheW
VTEGPTERAAVLVMTVGAHACAIPLQHVWETMRPLPIERMAGLPAFVLGVSVIRGAPVPVVDLGALLTGGRASASYGRLVTVRVGERRAALAVDAVVGSQTLDLSQLGALPPLLHDAGADLVDAIGARDAQLLVVLRATRLLPDEVWATLTSAQAPR